MVDGAASPAGSGGDRSSRIAGGCASRRAATTPTRSTLACVGAFVYLQLRDDLHAVDAFPRQRPSGALSGASAERPGAWMLYGRLGPVNFLDELEPQSSGGTRFGLGRTGPRLTGRAYIGLHRRFH